MARDARPSFRLITVQTPCHVDWATMTGSDAVRHCGSCRKNVYNLSAMTEAEAEALIAAAGDHCIRYYHRPDGTIVSASCAGTRHKAPSTVAAGLAASLTAAAAFAGIHAVTDQPARAASSGDDRVLVAMGMKLTLKIPPRRDEPVPDVAPSLAPACDDPWGCSEAEPVVADPPPTPDATAESCDAATPGRASLAGLIAGLLVLLGMARGFVRRHVESIGR